MAPDAVAAELTRREIDVWSGDNYAFELVRRFGSKPFSRCVEPAERLARQGFSVSWRLANQLSTFGKALVSVA